MRQENAIRFLTAQAIPNLRESRSYIWIWL